MSQLDQGYNNSQQQQQQNHHQQNTYENIDTNQMMTTKTGATSLSSSPPPSSLYLTNTLLLDNGNAVMDGTNTIAGSTGSSRSKWQRTCGRWICRLLQLCNTFAAVFLSIAVGFLFIQVQMLQKTISNDEQLIHTIQEQLQNQQMKQQTLNERVDNEHTFTMFQLAGTFTLITCLITMFHMTQHLTNWNEPVIQRKIVAILFMSPIYSITSWFSLVFIQSHGYLAVLKDFYESLVIYSFLSFLIAVLGRGDRHVAILALSYRADELKKPTRCFNSCYHPPPHESDQAKAAAVLLECQIWAMQFVLVRPITSILHFILESVMYNDSDDANSNDTNTTTTNHAPWTYFESPMFAVDMITNVSVFLAFHGLLKFYHTVHHDLAWCKPFSKFMTVKGIVFLTFWQGLLISILCNLDEPDTPGDSTSTISVSGNNDGNRFRFLAEQVLDNVTTLAPTFINMMNDTINDSGSGMSGSGTNTSIDYTNGTDHGYDSTGYAPFDSSSSTTTKTPLSPRERAAQIQNFLICVEMLFFTIAHWCVFPAIEWESNYRPQKMAKPGIGLKDLASDISYIVRNSTSARAYNKQQLGHHVHLQQVEEDGETIVDLDSTAVTSYESDEVVDDVGAIQGSRSYELQQYHSSNNNNDNHHQQQQSPPKMTDSLDTGILSDGPNNSSATFRRRGQEYVSDYEDSII